MAEHALRCVVLWSVLGLAGLARAQGAIEAFQFDSPQQEARYHHLIEEIRCPKCINTNLAGSDAPIAADLRATVLQQLKAGATDQQVLDYLQARYGDFVLYDPPLERGTVLLWLAPVVLIALGLGIVGTIVWRRRRAAVSPLTDAERARLDELLRTAASKDPT